ncbi:MAG: hypothetical protein AB7P21_25760 [Lautropia sp.]
MPAARLACLVLATSLACALPAFAESLATSASSAGSSASSAGSASLRGSSDSIRGSSDSSRDDRQVAEGEYRVTDVAAVDAGDGSPPRLRVAMAPAGARDAGRFTLELPARALADAPLAPGDLVSARHRDYGIEFARADTGKAFFLVLADAWTRDLQTHRVTR